jgi:valyl-tRNA synthetase
METVGEAIRLLRNLRADEKVPAGAVPAAWVRPAGPEVGELLLRERATIVRLARVDPLEFLTPDAPAPPGVGSRVAPLGECFVARPPAEAGTSETLEREREKLHALLEKTRGRLADPGFRERAPPDVVREAEEKARELTERIARIDEHLNPGASPPPNP